MHIATEPGTQPILHIEDDQADFEAVKRAFERHHITRPVQHFESGDDALDYLDTALILPSMILLDLNLPGTDGLEVLTTIKKSPKLKKIPVVVLSTSANERDIINCYEAGANSYIQKPVHLKGYIDAIQRLKDYWFEVVILPDVER